MNWLKHPLVFLAGLTLVLALIITQLLRVADTTPQVAAVLQPVAGVQGMRQPRASLAAEQLEPLAVENASAYAGASGAYAFLVSRHGHVVWERYWRTSAETQMNARGFSAALPVLLTGVAIENRALSPVERSIKVSSLIPLLEAKTQQTYAQYLSRELWKPLSANDAQLRLRAIDHPDADACCFYARPADWLRVAQLLLDDGRYQGTQLLPRGWVQRMLGQQLQLDKTSGALLLQDMQHHYLWLIPKLNLAVLRMGRPHQNWDDRRLLSMVLAGVRDRPAKPVSENDLSQLVPNH